MNSKTTKFLNIISNYIKKNPKIKCIQILNNLKIKT